jgi:hypothetical protein
VDPSQGVLPSYKESTRSHPKAMSVTHRPWISPVCASVVMAAVTADERLWWAPRRKGMLELMGEQDVPGCGEEATARRSRRRWPFVVGAVGLVVVAVAAWVLVAYAVRTRPGAESVGAAVRSFGSGGSEGVATGVRYLAPKAGVYVLKGRGSERISFPPNSQEDGATMPATVRYVSGGCWSFRVDYNMAHWESITYCPVGAQLKLGVDRVFQRWDFGTTTVSNLSVFRCRPRGVLLSAAPAVGQHGRWECKGTNTATAGSYRVATQATIVGTDVLRIGTTRVTAVHERQRTVLSGSQTGLVVEDWWFSASSGLPLRMTRQIVIHSPSPIGAVTYTEDGKWQMASLQVASARGAPRP